MPKKATVIRSFEDFVALPDSELARCLDAFRLDILREKARRETLSSDTGAVAGSLTQSEAMHKSDKDRWKGEFARETPIDALPIRYNAIACLKNLNIYCVEDLSEISAAELRVLPGMGLSTATRLGEVLQRFGLTFKGNPNPVAAMYERSHALRGQNRSSSEMPIDPESHIAELGLRASTLSQLLRNRCTTVSSLQSLSLRQFTVMFSRKTVLDIVARLAECGAPLDEDCSPFALWQHGVLRADELPFGVSLDDPIERAAPWLGRSLTQKLLECGFATVAQVVQAAGEDRLVSQAKLTPRARQATIDVLRERKLL